MLQKELAGGREAEPASAAVKEASPKLPFEREDLLGHGRLRERQLLRRAGERSASGNLAKGQQAAWIKH
jgi:hypothetical protein